MVINNHTLRVEVAYASLSEQKVIELYVEEGTTIQEVIILSGILSDFPEIDLLQQKVGIFGKRKTLNDVVEENDRVEIYRKLTIDPKEARRAKAKQKK